MSATTALLADRYRVDRRIAMGSVGEVWRGVDVQLDRPVAVKLLRAEHVGDQAILARFRAEAQYVGALSEPGVIRVYDYVEDAPACAPFLVMELVDGPSLADLLSAGPLEPARAMDVVAQTAAGLHAAHLAGLVHCDIKPGNLLIGPDGKVRITDFGTAQPRDARPAGRQRTLVGTPGYLAPERIAGAPATPASDLYALGIVAYECLAGVRPFRGTTDEVLAAHQFSDLPALPAAVPATAAKLVAELTAKDPADRPGRADIAARRAIGLRDQLTGLPASQRPLAPDASDATLNEIRLPQQPDGMPAPRRARYPRGAMLAGVVVAGLLCLVLAGVVGAVLARPAATPHGTHATPGASQRTVQVISSALVGRPVALVQQELRQLGLVVRVQWQNADQQAGGTVLAVSPSGRVRTGSVVVLTAGPGDTGQGNGGNGGGNGGGGGNGD